jgi:hypothetical protein
METSVYYYLDWYTKQRRSARCEILSRTDKTAVIRLLEYGPKGKPPKTKMRVYLSSLDLPKPQEPKQEPKHDQDLSWHDWTDI